MRFCLFIAICSLFILPAAWAYPEATLNIDVLHYEIEIKTAPELKRIAGSCKIKFRPLNQGSVIQLRLAEELQIARVVLGENNLPFIRRGEIVEVSCKGQILNTPAILDIYFGGAPRATQPGKKSGGFVWLAENDRFVWGASINDKDDFAWWPQSLNPGDKADSLLFSAICPPGIMAVSNGNHIRSVVQAGNFVRHIWRVSSPILANQVVLFLGDYVEFPFQTQTFPKIDCYMLQEDVANIQGALLECRDQFMYLHTELSAYPYPQEGLTLVETPFPISGSQLAIPITSTLRLDSYQTDLQLSLSLSKQWLGSGLGGADREAAKLINQMAAYIPLWRMMRTGSKEHALIWLDSLYNNMSALPDMLDEHSIQAMFWMYGLQESFENFAKWESAFKTFVSRYQGRSLSYSEIKTFFGKQAGKDLDPLLDHAIKVNEPIVLAYKWQDKRNLSYRLQKEGIQLPLSFEIEGMRIFLKADSTWKNIVLDKDIQNPELPRHPLVIAQKVDEP